MSLSSSPDPPNQYPPEYQQHDDTSCLSPKFTTTPGTVGTDQIRVLMHMLMAPKSRVPLMKPTMTMTVAVTVTVTITPTFARPNIHTLITTPLRTLAIAPMHLAIPIPIPNRRLRSHLLPRPLPTLPLTIRILYRTPRPLIRNAVLARAVIVLLPLVAARPPKRGVDFLGLDIPSCPVGAGYRSSGCFPILGWRGPFADCADVHVRSFACEDVGEAPEAWPSGWVAWSWVFGPDPADGLFFGRLGWFGPGGGLLFCLGVGLGHCLGHGGGFLEEWDDRCVKTGVAWTGLRRQRVGLGFDYRAMGVVILISINTISWMFGSNVVVCSTALFFHECS